MSAPAPLAKPVLFSQRRRFTADSAISFLMQQGVENPNCISLAAGLVDPATLPLTETGQAVAAVLRSDAQGRTALQYGTTQGSHTLRQHLVDHFLKLERATQETDADSSAAPDIDPRRVIVTTGSQQLLSLVCEVLFDPGDICLVAGPTYFVFSGNLDGVGARALTVETDEYGMRPDSLEQMLQQLDDLQELQRVKLIYVVSYYDNPSGISLATERRREIVEIAHRWSKEHRILVLEDAAYRELRYDGPVYPSLWSFDQTGEQVIYTQTFSKTFAPGLRVGFGIVPEALIEPLCDRKGNEDFGSANMNQAVIAEVLQSGAYATHVEQVRAGYRVKRDAMLAAAEADFTDLPGVSWVHPQGGLYVWMTLPEQIETGFNSDLFRTAVANGVMYVPGELCYTGNWDHRPRHQMRLSFGVQTPTGITLGMQRLAQSIQLILSK